MIEQTIAKIEERLRSAETIAPEKRAELLELLAGLKGEVGELSRTHADQAQVIAGHAERSAGAVAGGDSSAVQESLEGLSASVADFEESHPRLVEVVNRICVALSGLGI